MNLVTFKIRLKNLNQRLIRLQLPELCVALTEDEMKAAEGKITKRRNRVRREDRIRLALVEMRDVLECAARFAKEIEEGAEGQPG